MAPSAETNGVTNGTNGHHGLDWTTFHNVIDGKLESTKKTRHSINPATGKPNPEVPLSTPEDVDKAMNAAKKAFRGWADTPYAKRQEALLAYADGIEAETEGFAKMLTQEQGKPVKPPHLSTMVDSADLSPSSNLPEQRLLPPCTGSGRLPAWNFQLRRSTMQKNRSSFGIRPWVCVSALCLGISPSCSLAER